MGFIKKILLRSAIKSREKEQFKTDNELKVVDDLLKDTLSKIDYFVLFNNVNSNVKRNDKSMITKYEKKLSNLTENTTLPFLPKEIIQNFSSHNLTKEEKNIKEWTKLSYSYF